jgi:hypothetical protein
LVSEGVLRSISPDSRKMGARNNEYGNERYANSLIRRTRVSNRL